VSAEELAAWLRGRGWTTRVVDEDTVEAERPGRRNRYERQRGMLDERWRVERERVRR